MKQKRSLPCGCVVEREGEDFGTWRWLESCGKRCLLEMTVGRDMRPRKEADR